MNAVMARIFGLAGSGGALRWAWTQGAKKINAEQKRMEMRKLPRRMWVISRWGAAVPACRRRAGPLQDTGFGGGDAGFGDALFNSLSPPAAGRHAALLQRSVTQRGRLNEGGDAGDALADDQLVDVVGAFVGEDALEVVHVAHDAVIVDDAVGAQNVAGFARGFERDGHVIHF